MHLHSPSVAIEPSPPGSGNTGLCRSTRCLGAHLVPVSLDLAAKASSASVYKLTLQVAELYLGITSSEQTEATVPSSIYIKSTWESASVV